MRPAISLGLRLLFVVSILAAGGCSQTYGGGSDVHKLESFAIEKNKTTEQEVIAHFGPPISTTTNSDGSKILMWSGAEGQTHGSGPWGTAFLSMVPGAILLAHDDMDVHTSSITVTVRNGIVVDYNIQEGDQKTHLY